jgi:hypothetical protein
MVVRGGIKTRESIKEIIARYQQLKDLPADKKRKWDYIHNNIQDSDSQLSKKRVAVKTEDFDAKRSRNKAQNKLQQRAGCIDLTPILKDQTPYTGLYKTTDTTQILKEMEFRGLPIDGGWKNQWLPQLRESEKERGNLNQDVVLKRRSS